MDNPTSTSKVKPVGVLPVKRRKLDTNWELCVICQTEDPDARISTDDSIEKFKSCFKVRQQCEDDSQGESFFERLQGDLEKLSILKAKWHRACYSSFTSSLNISRIQKRFEKRNIGTPEPSTSSGAEIDLQAVQSSKTSPRKSRSVVPAMDILKCIFCQQRKRTHGKSQFEAVFQVQTTNVSDQVSRIALHNSTVGCRLGALEPIAAEVKYHKTCLKKYAKGTHKKPDNETETNVYQVAFDELVKEIDEGLGEGHIYDSASLTSRYNELLTTFGKEESDHRTQMLLQKIRDHYGDKIDQVSSFQRNMPSLIFPRVAPEIAVQALQKACFENEENEIAESLSETGELAAKDQFLMQIFYHVAEKIKTDLKSSIGLKSITAVSESEARKVVPDSLYLLLSLILGENGTKKADEQIEKQVLSIGQDIVYAHNNRKLTPKHIGLGLAIHQATRSKDLVQLVHSAGNCVSYDTILRIDTSIANHLLQEFTQHGNKFIPENLTEDRFVHFAADNIDILEETIDGKGTFHATQLVAFQRGPPKLIEDNIELGRARVLQNVPLELLKINEGPVVHRPEPKGELKQLVLEYRSNEHSNEEDLAWFLCRSETAEDQNIPSWTDFNKALAKEAHPITTVGYTPILPYPAHEFDTLYTVLQHCQSISHSLNQDQSVLTCDEALYSKVKQIVWSSNCYDNIIVRLGGFHMLLNFLKVIGQHFCNSGLAELWNELDIYGENTASTILQGKHYNRCVRALKLTSDALWRVYLHKLLIWAAENDESLEEITTAAKTINRTFEQKAELPVAWSAMVEQIHLFKTAIDRFDEKNKCNKTFLYWRVYMKLAGTALKFLRADREGNWLLHLEAVKEMLPWFFVYDHTNYARWGSVYLSDMLSLEESSKGVYEEFMKGNFVVKHTGRSFNEISADQALEHVNRVSKVAGGLIGITQTESARDRWCITYNYRSHLSEKAHTLFGVEHGDEYMDERKNIQLNKRDESDVRKLANEFSKLNVFGEGNELVNIFTREVATKEITCDLMNAERQGTEHANEFYDKRLRSKTVSFFGPLAKIKLKTFKDLYSLKITTSKSKKDISLDSNMLVRQLFSAAQSGRDINLKTILQKELRSPPPSLFNSNASLRQSPKSVLANLVQINNKHFDSLDNLPGTRTAKLIDGQALVQAIGKPKGASTFGDLCDAFLTTVMSHFKKDSCERIDVIFDRYDELSIKSGTREKRRGELSSVQCRIQDRNTPLPKKWDRFIHSRENKAALAELLSNEIVIKAETLEGSLQLLTSGGFKEADDVKGNLKHNIDHLRSSHEEADTRFILHVSDCTSEGYDRIIVYSRDTDVLMLLIHFVDAFPQQTWVMSGTWSKPKFVSIHDVSESMGLNDEQRKCLLAYHAITGCDTTSSFYGHSKKSGWSTFQKHFNLIKSLGIELMLTESDLRDIEKFIIQLYSKTSPGLQSLDNIDDLRALLFKTIKTFDKLPPTRDSLTHHILRAHYQAFIWINANVPKPALPNVSDCGWKIENGKMIPVLTSVPPISMKEIELISCQCKTGCRNNRCRCVSNQTKCLENVCHSTLTCFNQYNIDHDNENVIDDPVDFDEV